MPPTIRQKHLATGLAINGALLFAVIIGAIITRSALTTDIGWVRHTTTVINSLHRLQRLAIDAESKQRGFILTGNESYLAAYKESVNAISAHTADLLELTIDNPSQQKRILAVERANVTKFSDLQHVIDLMRTDGLDAARAFILRDPEIRDMQETLALVDSMLDEETRLLAQRDQARQQTLASLTVIVAVGAAIALASSIIGYLLLKRAQRSEERRRELAIQKAEAERADREKSAFLANMSHEIRTPMNAILGFTELLGELVDAPLERKYVAAIHSSGHMLLLLINDILDLSKIESGRLELSPGPTDLNDVANSIDTLFQKRADDAGIDFKISFNAPPCTLLIDRLRLRQILINLVSNAIKFTKKGHVHVRLTTGRRGAVADFTATVEDTGIGMTERDLAKVFRAFTQGTKQTGDAVEGTGLGLTISRRLALLMGGDIAVTSKPGEGTTFTLSIPAVPVSNERVVAEAQPGPVDFSSLPPLKILVADDNEANRQLIAGFLQNSGHDLVEAKDGLEAVQLASDQKPDLILMDIRMPRLDGRAAREQIKAVSDTPIIAVTASSMLKDEKRLRATFDGFVRKPLSRAALYNEIANLIPPRETANTAIPEASSPASSAPLLLPPVVAHRVAECVPQLTSTMAIGEISAFASELSSLADAEGHDQLKSLTTALSQACDAFELQIIESLLDRLVAATPDEGHLPRHTDEEN